MEGNTEKYLAQLRELESKVSELEFELDDMKFRLDEEEQKRKFYQLIADFTFGWELWFEPDGKIKYCSPSCFDLTGFTANQILTSSGINELLVYEPDRTKYNDFLQRSLDQLLVNQALEFRILTRTKQLRWCIMNVRGVYNSQGKYIGIRSSIQDITRLKGAMGQIQEMEAGKEYEERTRKRLQTELNIKDRELVSFLLQLSQKNELLTKVGNQIKKINAASHSKKESELRRIMEFLENTENIPLDWSLIENQLERIHPGFFNRLVTKHPMLSLKDKKMCGYIRLGLSSKEISGLQNLTPKSVEIARVRLRKKLKLQSGIRLLNYLNQL